MKKTIKGIFCLILAVLILISIPMSFSAEETIAYSDVVYSAMDYFKENKDEVIEKVYQCYYTFRLSDPIKEGDSLPDIPIEDIAEGYDLSNFIFYCELGGMGDGYPDWFYMPSDKQSILKCIKSYGCKYQQIIGNCIVTIEYQLENGKRPIALGSSTDQRPALTIKEQTAAALDGYADNNYMYCQIYLTFTALVFDDNDTVIGLSDLSWGGSCVYPYEKVKAASARGYEQHRKYVAELGEPVYGFSAVKTEGITPLPNISSVRTIRVPVFVYPFLISVILLAAIIGILFYVYKKRIT